MELAVLSHRVDLRRAASAARPRPEAGLGSRARDLAAGEEALGELAREALSDPQQLFPFARARRDL